MRDLIFLGHIGKDTPLTGVTGAGAASLAIYAAVIGLGIAIVLARYRSAET